MARDSAVTLCADMIRTGDRERWLAALLAPEPGRDALVALYAFNLETARVRDMVSEPLLGRIRLQWWRDAVAGIAGGVVAAHPVIEALAPLVAGGRLPGPDLLALIDAREAALDGWAPESLAAFMDHADATAGALNRLALGLLELPGRDDVTEAGGSLGRAQAVTGTLIAVPAEAARGRVALPADLLAAHGVSMEALLAGRPGPGLVEVARDLAARACRDLAAARAVGAKVPRAALPVLALARMVEARLRRLDRAGFDPFAAGLEPAPFVAPLAVLRAAIGGRY